MWKSAFPMALGCPGRSFDRSNATRVDVEIGVPNGAGSASFHTGFWGTFGGRGAIVDGRMRWVTLGRHRWVERHKGADVEIGVPNGAGSATRADVSRNRGRRSQWRTPLRTRLVSDTQTAV